MKKSYIASFCAIIAAVLGGIGYLLTSDVSTPSTSEGAESAKKGLLAAVDPAAAANLKSLQIPRPTKSRTQPGDRAKPVLGITQVEEAEDEDDTRTPEEKKLAENIEKSLDNEDFKLAAACADKALTCPNAEIRQSMVDTLGWFGGRAIPEMTPFLADPDQDVRDSALMEWTMAVSDVEDDAERIKIVELAMQALSDEDQLEEISSEYMGVDEAMAVNSLLTVIEAGGTEAGVAKAKETYEFVTGEEFTSRADAEKWVLEQQSEGGEEPDPLCPVP